MSCLSPTLAFSLEGEREKAEKRIRKMSPLPKIEVIVYDAPTLATISDSGCGCGCGGHGHEHGHDHARVTVILWEG